MATQATCSNFSAAYSNVSPCYPPAFASGISIAAAIRRTAFRTTFRALARRQRAETIGIGRGLLKQAGERAGARRKRPECKKAEGVYRGTAQFKRRAKKMQIHRIEQREKYPLLDATDDERRPQHQIVRYMSAPPTLPRIPGSLSIAASD